MSVRMFALIFGAVYGLVGLLGFVPGITTPPTDPGTLAVEAGHGHILGLFPTNIVHNLVHVAVGVWGLASYRDFGMARLFSRANAVLFGLLTVLGLIPGLNTLFGLVPLYGHDVWLHALSAGLSAYFGFVAPARETQTAAR